MKILELYVEIHNIMNRQRLSLKFDNIPEKLKEKQITKISVIAYAFVTDTEFVALRQSGNYDGYGDEIVAVYTVVVNLKLKAM